jgi:cytochrome b pre-mRNA-processing protein 3
MLQHLFRARPAQRLGEPLYHLAVEQARRPAFYAELGVPDRIDARFELYTLHVLLLVMRLRAEGEEGAEMAQALFDAYVSALDHALRELGVGDLSLAKKMRRLGESLYGRMKAFEAPLAAGDASGLAAALARNVYGDQGADALALARYALASRDRLASQSLAEASSRPAWAEVLA